MPKNLWLRLSCSLQRPSLPKYSCHAGPDFGITLHAIVILLHQTDEGALKGSASKRWQSALSRVKEGACFAGTQDQEVGEG
jgi:hypothetical protein